MTRAEKRARIVPWLAVGGVGVLVLIALASAALRPKQPVYHGTPLYEWVARYHSADTNWNSPQRKSEMETCAAAVRAIGPKALPFAMADVNAYGPLWKYGDVRWVAYQIRRFLKLPDPVRLDRGMTILKILGPIAEPCLPELAANVSNGRLFSENALIDIGPTALPAFTNLLIHSRPPRTAALINALVSGIIDERIYPDEAAMAVPALIQVYRSRDNSDWPYAVYGLGFVHQRPELCVLLLAQGLSDTNARIRMDCVQALMSFGDAASGHAQEVAALFNGSDAKSRTQICMTLGSFPAASEIAVPALVQGLQDPAERVREWAAIALGKLALQPEAAVPALQRSLDDSSADVRAVSARALGRFGSQAATAVPALEQSALDSNSRVRMDSTNSLRLIRTGEMK